MSKTEISHIVNGHIVDERLVRGGELPKCPGALAFEALTGLKALGVRRVICLKNPSDESQIEIDNERTAVEAAGLIFLHRPLDNEGKFSYHDAKKIPDILALINEDKGRVFIHCKKGADRTGTVVACYRISRGWTADRAIKEMRQYGNAWWNWGMRGAVREFSAKLASASSRASS